MNEARPALHFAFWTYLWFLLLPAAYFLCSTPGFPDGAALSGALGSVWDSLHILWGLLLMLFPVALLAFRVTPRWGKVLTLALLPLLLLLVQVPAEAVAFAALYLWPATLLASLPDLLRRLMPPQKTYA